MAGTFQLTYVPGYYTLSDSSRGLSNSAFVLTKTTTTARFPCSSSSSRDQKLNVRLTCAVPNTRRPFVCRASSGERDTFVLTKTTTTARFPCSSSSSRDHKLNVRLTCAAPNTRRPFVCRASSGERDSERETSLRERFEKWCQTHDVVYGGKDEWMRRFEIYKSNLQHIDYTNSLNLSYKLTDNKFADLTEAEFKARYCGLKISDDEAVAESENSSLERPSQMK